MHTANEGWSSNFLSLGNPRSWTRTLGYPACMFLRGEARVHLSRCHLRPTRWKKVAQGPLLGALQVLDAVFQGGTLSWSSALPSSPPLTPVHILPFVGTARRMAGRRKGMKCCHLFPSLDISEDNPPSGD